MSDTCFWTYASEDFEVAFQRMQASLRTFHPDIPHLRFTEDDLAYAMRVDSTVTSVGEKNTYPYFHHLASQNYRRAIHIDADVVVCSPLTELFTDDYDVAVILDHDKRSYNLGFFATMNPLFAQEYKVLSGETYRQYPDGEQGAFNGLVASGRYHIKRLDDFASYGTSNSYSLKEITKQGDRLIYEGQEVRIIHIAARWQDPLKLQLDFTGHVKPEVLEYLHELMT